MKWVLRLIVMMVIPAAVASGQIVVGAGSGSPHVKVINPLGMGDVDGSHVIANASLLQNFFAYDPGFTGGVRVASGDVNGDGVPDIVTAPGHGGGPHVRIFDGTTAAELQSFFAFDPGFAGGVHVAHAQNHGPLIPPAGPNLVFGQGPGGPNVLVTQPNGSPVGGIFPFGPSYTGGIRVAAGDINGDGVDDIIAGTGPGFVPTVCTFSGVDGSFIGFFNPFGTNFTGGVYVASGDVNNDGLADIIISADTGGSPHVRVFSGDATNDDAPLADFFAFGAAFTGGVRVAAADLNGDGFADIITGAGPGGPPHVRVFDGTMLNDLDTFGEPDPGARLADFFAFDPNFTGGVFVGGSNIPEPSTALLLTAMVGLAYTRRRRS